VSLNYLCDENVDAALVAELRRRAPGLTVWQIGDPGALPRGTPDPAILIWCEEHGFVLVTNNRRTMPLHLAEHLGRGRHIPGIFQLNAGMGMGETIDLLLLATEALRPNEHQDQIKYLPLL
jgi:hypothetical protein